MKRILLNYFTNNYRLKPILTLIVLVSVSMTIQSWGFFAHKKINRIAVFSLPSGMIGFYKDHIEYLESKAVNPDKRRYVLKNEAPRHYIDLDVYGDSAVYQLPRYWDDAVEKYTKDTLLNYGIVPWHINNVYHWLVKAFEERNTSSILRLSADLGHYVADANVPLHTTENYNGQLTGQEGIHGFWESRLPELFSNNYNLFVGKAEYVERPQLRAWEAVKGAHLALDSVLNMEKMLSKKISEGKKYSYEERGQSTVKVYSYKYSKEYHDLLNGMVERQMRRSIKMVADLWYTAWINAGQPDLSNLGVEGEEEVLTEDSTSGSFREHESGLKVNQ